MLGDVLKNNMLRLKNANENKKGEKIVFQKQ